MLKNNTCNNCGKQGHIFNQCKQPIISYGVILCSSTCDGVQYLMIRRKNSFGYSDFMRGRYLLNNIDQIQDMIDEMSSTEKKQILCCSFEQLWSQMWGHNYIGTQYKGEESTSQKKFDALKSGVVNNNVLITLDSLVNNSSTNWTETEWEFPKGRRNYQEKDIDCAIREFEEETGLARQHISLIENVLPFEENFIGSNHKSYKHKFFLAYTEHELTDMENYQKSEVSKLEWKTIAECLEAIRPYNLEKKQLIININKVLKEYRLN